MNIKTFGQLSKNDVNLAGGKGASLGEMTQAGLPVPPGFVVVAQAFDRFVEAAGLGRNIEETLAGVDFDASATIDRASESIRRLILDALMPEDIQVEIEAEFKKLGAELVAVRSSATAEDSSAASWAGELETYLNVTAGNLLESVKLCWSSLFTPRAIFYRFEKGLAKHHVSVAVVVQKMVQSEVSGIAFTVHPVTEDYGRMIIEAGYGLGEAIVGGMITPDSYVIVKDGLKIEDTYVSSQEMMIVRSPEGTSEQPVPAERQELQKFADDRITELARICLDIEKHYGFPCDIEWAFEAGKIYITQSRPITTLSNVGEVKKRISLTKFYTREHSLFYSSVWREANCIRNQDWLGKNIEYILFVRPAGTDSIEVWYAMSELDEFRQGIEEKITSDKEWSDKVFAAFEYHWKHLHAYYQKVSPLTLGELEDFYAHWVGWWTPLAILMQIPEVLALPTEIREKALRLRAETQEYSDKGDELYSACIMEIYPHMAAHLSVLTPQEIFTSSFPDEKELENRKRGWFMLNNSMGVISDLHEAMEAKNFEFETIEADSESIKGTVANPGRATGKVVVVNSVDQLSKVKEGDVLVTFMTDPRYVPALKKVAAIVTDEGGITCHAAIVARELQKPCVIGTKIATSTLKDGDLVEVDAEKGVVKIINAASIAEGLEDTVVRERQAVEAVSSEISKAAFERYVKFPEIPVLYFEATCKCYVGNPYFSLFKPERYPNLISVLSENYEAWQDKSKRMIVRNPDQIRLIMEDCLQGAKKHVPYLKDFLSSSAQPSKAELKERLSALNTISTEIYHRFIFFTDECFETADAELLARLPEVRMQVSEEAVALLFDSFAKLLDQIAEETGKPLPHINRLTSNELVMLIDGAGGWEEDATKRPIAFVTSDNGVSAYLGEDATEIRDALLRHNPENVLSESASKQGVISGVPAHRGLARGRVVLLNEGDYSRASEALKGHKDFILVTPMTRPELVPVLKDAAAIVTDEGGITCHAAIVARELGKPCVIGTKVATQVLRDGDLVEVDADAGIIRILSE